MLTEAFTATRSRFDDFASVKTCGRTIVLGIRGRSISLDDGLREPREGMVTVGVSSGPLEVLEEWLSSCSGNVEPERIWLNPVKDVYADLDAGFTAILAKDSRLIGLRDTLGQCPLFYSRTSEYSALSSSKKILWALGSDKPQIYPSGVLTWFSGQTMTSQTVREVKPLSSPLPYSFTEASGSLVELLCSSVKSAVGSARRVGILFSGGVDSAVIASTAKHLGLETHLYCGAFGDTEYLLQAKKAAEMLEFDLDDRLVDEEDVGKALRYTVWAAESANTLQVAVAFPLNVAVQMAVERGETVLLSGSGADELFGGYSRYLQILEDVGEEALSRAMFNDVLRLNEMDLLRDGAVGESNGIRLLAPFLNVRLVEFALSLPVAFKVNGPSDRLRKHLLREAARKLDVSAEVACSPKKAAQYSSGSLKAIRRLARSQGLSTEEYLNRVLRDIRKDIAEKMRASKA